MDLAHYTYVLSSDRDRCMAKFNIFLSSITISGSISWDCMILPFMI